MSVATACADEPYGWARIWTCSFAFWLEIVPAMVVCSPYVTIGSDHGYAVVWPSKATRSILCTRWPPAIASAQDCKRSCLR